MKSIVGKFCMAFVSLALVTSSVAQVSAQAPDLKSAGHPPPPELSAAQRQTITQELIAKFQGHVAQFPKGDVAAWSSKLTKVVATADAANVIRATTMSTLTSMHAALIGHVPKQSSSVAAASLAGSPGPRALGSAIADTTYTPLPNGRCRVAD